MEREQRERLAEEANATAKGSRHRGAPRIEAESSAREIERWLQWNDPNGCHTIDRAEAEGFDPYSLDDAWAALEEMLED